MRPPSIENIYYRSRSGNEDVINTLKSQDQDRYYGNITDKRDSSKNRLSILDELKSIMIQELEGVIYPKRIKFGFISFIVFAILGVIMPLVYNTWEHQVSEFLRVPVENNLFVFILFIIGLSLNFIYIAMELREATQK